MIDNKAQSDLQTYLDTLNFTHFGTVNYKKRLAAPVFGEVDRALKNDLRHWNRRMLRCLYGRNYKEKNHDDAFLFVAFIQNGPRLGKEHAHMLVRVPDRLADRFMQNAVRKFKGPNDVRIGRAIPHAAVRYCSREYRLDPDRMIFSCEFRND